MSDTWTCGDIVDRLKCPEKEDRRLFWDAWVEIEKLRADLASGNRIPLESATEGSNERSA